MRVCVRARAGRLWGGGAANGAPSTIHCRPRVCVRVRVRVRVCVCACARVWAAWGGGAANGAPPTIHCRLPCVRASGASVDLSDTGRLYMRACCVSLLLLLLLMLSTTPARRALL